MAAHKCDRTDPVMLLIQLTTIAGTVDAVPEKVAELIWLCQILTLILYTITTNPLKMQYRNKINSQGLQR